MISIIIICNYLMISTVLNMLYSCIILFVLWSTELSLLLIFSCVYRFFLLSRPNGVCTLVVMHFKTAVRLPHHSVTVMLDDVKFIHTFECDGNKKNNEPEKLHIESNFLSRNKPMAVNSSKNHIRCESD